MSPLYTRNGDNGRTGFLGEGRVPKYHLRMEALGAIDEATAALGLARSLSQAEQIAQLVIEVQRDLYNLMAEVAATPENAERFRTLGTARVQWLESQADAVSAVAPIPNEFILPGDTQAGAAFSMARTIVRRAERRVAELLDVGEIENPILLQYLNRLSSLCFVLELLENQAAGKETKRAREKTK